MKVLPYRKLSFQDFPGAEAWFALVPAALNGPLDSVYKALSNNLTFTDNFQSEDFTGPFVHNVSTPVQLKLFGKRTGNQNLTGLRPTFIISGFASGQVVTGATITGYQSNSMVNVTVLFNGAPTSPVTVTLRFFA